MVDNLPALKNAMTHSFALLVLLLTLLLVVIGRAGERGALGVAVTA